jgi:hypothetical protein
MGLGFLPSDPLLLGGLAFGVVVFVAVAWSMLMRWLRAILLRLTLHHIAFSAAGGVGTMLFERVAPEQYAWVMDVLGSLVGLSVAVPSRTLAEGGAALGAVALTLG